MLLIAFLCFAVLVLAWLMAPGKPIALSSMVHRERVDTVPADVEMQH
ncbi:MAG TPA: hypothetical protein VM450_08795 [Thermomicrobiales bacterium]|nr:hypothetical protein [Thermomicrobiales bacterium]